MTKKRTYMSFDLKSFYASVECVERGLDPFTTNLIVADPSRGERTICLAATPAIKAKLRIFGKPEIHGHRRMGVILATADTVDAAREKAERAYNALEVEVL